MNKAPCSKRTRVRTPNNRTTTGFRVSGTVPVGLAVAGANRHDMKLARETLESVVVPRPEPTAEHSQGLCLDKGYDYQEARDIVAEFGFIAHIRVRGEEAIALEREAGFRAPENLALIRWVALNMPRHNGPPRDSIRRRKLRAALNDDYRSRLLLGQSSPATASAIALALSPELFSGSPERDFRATLDLKPGFEIG